MKKLSEKQKHFFYIGLTLFISLSLVVIVSSFISQATLVLDLLAKVFEALASLWIGLIIAYLISPIQRFFENKLFKRLTKSNKGLSRGLSVATSLILLLAVAVILLILVIPQLVTTFGTLAKNLPTYYDNLRTWIIGILGSDSSLGIKFTNFLDGGYEKLIIWVRNDLIANVNILGTATDALMNAANMIINFFVGLIIAIYLLCDKENFLLISRKTCAALLSEKWYTRLMTFCSEAHHVFGEFIIGKILDSLLVGVVTFVFMWLADIPYATLVAVLLAVCNLIPFFGQFIGMIPSFLLILAINPIKAVIWLVVMLVYMQIDANVISPKILGNSIGIGSFWILFSITVFGGLFGIVGMLIGVPVFAMIYRIVKRALDKKLHKKGLPTEAYEYGGSSPTYPDRKSRRKLDGEFSDTIVEKFHIPERVVPDEGAADREDAAKAGTENVANDVAKDTAGTAAKDVAEDAAEEVQKEAQKGNQKASKRK